MAKKHIIITPSLDPDQYVYKEKGKSQPGFSISLNTGDKVKVTVHPDCRSEDEPRSRKTFWLVEQRPTPHSMRVGAFRYRGKKRMCRGDVPGVYESDPNGVLRLRAVKGLKPERGGLHLRFIVCVDGYPPDDPDVEVSC